MSVDFFHFADEMPRQALSFAQDVRAYGKKHWKPHLAQYFEQGSWPPELMRELGDLRILGGSIQEEACPALDLWSYALALKELEAFDSGIRSFASVQSSLGMQSVAWYGSEEQKKKILPKAAKGDLILAFGLTEPQVGSDPAAMTTQISRRAQKGILSGHKKWLTNGGLAHYFVLWVKCDQQVRAVLLERERPGLEIREIRDKYSLRVSSSSEVILHECEISEEDFLPGATSLGKALRVLNEARFGIMWGAVGIAEECYREALEYARSRLSFGRPIAGKQLIQERLVQMHDHLVQAQSTAFRLTQLKERSQLLPAHVSYGKRRNVRHALEIARLARTILAAEGITFRYSSLRHALNLESVLTYEGTEDVHDLVVGHFLTGESAF